MSGVYIISKCLLGVDCKYNGGNNNDPDVIQFCEGKRYVAVCPETSGGLTSPRDPAEITGDRVIDRSGRDLTAEFRRGAEVSLDESIAFAQSVNEQIAGAVLKANSPSCGSGMIYDGTFTGTRVPGDGVFASMLKERGIPVYTEHDIAGLTEQ